MASSDLKISPRGKNEKVKTEDVVRAVQEGGVILLLIHFLYIFF